MRVNWSPGDLLPGKAEELGRKSKAQEDLKDARSSLRPCFSRSSWKKCGAPCLKTICWAIAGRRSCSSPCSIKNWLCIPPKPRV